MLKKTTFTLLLSLFSLTSAQAAETSAWELFGWMEETLIDDWKLSPAEAQIETESYKHKALVPLIGTNMIGVAFKLIGGEVTIQEELLPGTAKQMVTMYHCKDIACSNLKATHYCSKQNQPEFLANLSESTPNKIVFECDMSTELCQSDEDHIHRIVHELSNNGNHLKSSYFAWKNKELSTIHSIYHFDRK